MKFTSSAALLGSALCSGVAAYPQIAAQILNARATPEHVERDVVDIEGRQINPPPAVPPRFDPSFQYVSNKGKYKFVAPGPTDQRGVCPGLNALANHGYMPHTGVGTINDFIESTYNGFGMGRDLGGFLGVYGAIFDGNFESYSIGFATPLVPSISGMLGTPQGLGGSHNKYENDASPVRGDLYKYGNAYLSQLSLFKELYNKQAGVPADQVNYDIPLIIRYRKQRFDNSIATNPYFFNAPFSGAIASTAAFSFIYRFMANKSAEYPEGRLDRNVLKSFYSITGDTPANFKYTPGHEKIPDNWYKRALDDPYNIPFFTVDSAAFGLYQPDFFSIGGNTGTVNSFVGIDPQNITGGVTNIGDLSNPKKLACYMFQLGVETLPDALEGLFTDITPAKSKLTQAFKTAFASFNCPKLARLQYNQSGLKQYPGYSQSYYDYKGKGTS